MRILVCLGVALLSGNPSAQCCLGAQDVEGVSENGLYRVLARSLRGTGPGIHGPYHYDFRFQELEDDGDWKTVGTFEQRWNARKHFSMGILVSPTGNGFLLGTSLQPGLVLYGRNGTRLRELWADADTWIGIEGSESWRYWRTRVAFPPDPEAETWLRRMLHWDENLGERQRPASELALQQLLGGNGEANRELVVLGLSALPVLEAALPRLEGTGRRRVRDALEAIALLAAGHSCPHRNLELLCSLLDHPNAELAATARSRLLRILPGDTLPETTWIREHSDRLRWDAVAGRYRLFQCKSP